MSGLAHKEAFYENQTMQSEQMNVPANKLGKSVRGPVVQLMDEEYALAKEIMSIVRMHLTANPQIDTCKVSRLCEMMLVYM